MAEKRVEKRHRKRMPLRFGTDGQLRLAFTEDISSDGLFIITPNVFPPRTQILVELNIPGHDPVSLVGIVRWAKKLPPAFMNKIKGGMGVRITSFHSGEEVYRMLCEQMDNR